jgi:hypothetical protein
MPVPGQQPVADRHGIAPRHQPIAVVLDLMHPVRLGRRALSPSGSDFMIDEP